MAERPPAPSNDRGSRQRRPPSGVARQALPTMVMLAVLVALFLTFQGVRAVRGGGSSAHHHAAVQHRALRPAVHLPSGWRLVRQQRPLGAASRWAAGPRHAIHQAYFITVYRLRHGASAHAVLAEAQGSLRSTGAPATVRAEGGPKVDGRSAWWYHYHSGSIHIDTALVRDHDRLYQLSCQSLRGPRGASMRASCARLQRQLKLGTDDL